MAKPKASPVTPASLPAEKAIPILEKLVSQADAILKETSDPVRQQWAHSAKGALLAALGSAHPNIEAFDAAHQSGFYYLGMTDADIRKQGDDKIRNMVAILKSTIEQLRWQVPEADIAGAYDSGDEYRFYKDLKTIVGFATKELFVTDNYLDNQLFDVVHGERRCFRAG